MKTNATLEQVTKELDKKIASLQALKASMAEVFGGEAVVGPMPAPTVKKNKQKRAVSDNRSPRNYNTDLITKVLLSAGGPMGLGEILEALQKRGWITSSRYPRNLIRSTLVSLETQRRVRKVGEDWELYQQPSPESSAIAYGE